MNKSNLTTLPLTHAHTVKPEYIDRMGHMNVMYYTHIFDKAVLGFFLLFGFGTPYFASTTSGSMAVERHTRYLNEVRLDEDVAVFTRAIGRGRSSIHFMHFMQRVRDGAFIATTEIITLHMDMTLRKSAPFPSEIAKQYDALLATHQALDWKAPLCGAMGIGKRQK